MSSVSKQLGFEGAQPAATGQTVVPPGGAAEDLHLRLPQPGAVEPAPGARGAAQRRADVADRPPGAGLQDHRRLPQGPRRRPSATSVASSCCCADDCKLFADGIVAIDGSKFKAVNNRDKNFSNRKIEVRRQQLEHSINRYLAELDRADRQPEHRSPRAGVASEGEDRQAQGADARARPRSSSDCRTTGRAADLADRPGRPLDGHQPAGIGGRRLQRPGRGRRQAPHDRCPRGHQLRSPTEGSCPRWPRRRRRRSDTRSRPCWRIVATSRATTSSNASSAGIADAGARSR